MPEIKISELPAVITPADTDEFETVQVGTSKKETRGQIVNGPIATHAGVTISVHNFDASGNAPPQTHTQAVANGGTGAVTAQSAINTLSNVAGATNEYVLTKDTASGNAIFKIGVASNKFHFSAIECLHTSSIEPWVETPLIGGTKASKAGIANHPGIFQINCLAAINSGYCYAINEQALLIAGSEITEFIFNVVITTNTRVRLGFQDSTTVTLPTDGVVLRITGDIIEGVTYNNTITSTTTTSYTIVANTWYRGKIVVNANATQVNFYLYNEAGTQLWTNNLTTNIPTATGRETGHGIIVYTIGEAAQEIFNLDYMNIYNSKLLVR